ncbi:hypothetical protein SKAU_G00144050 [Synaphobranchus kaupii]|uniref:Uncharacterized protein n=1 Tax=Synaphobranchus kaupii TaxID=118154 RepID=A0A9Q1FT97_SYNKA|nr:hypothetical protein SKAU_G00144050 [Synaphobranchus kaupii]
MKEAVDCYWHEQMNKLRYKTPAPVRKLVHLPLPPQTDVSLPSRSITTEIGRTAQQGALVRKSRHAELLLTRAWTTGPACDDGALLNARLEERTAGTPRAFIGGDSSLSRDPRRRASLPVFPNLLRASEEFFPFERSPLCYARGFSQRA